jgi:hypothetical protein
MMPPITESRRIRTDIPMPTPAPALSDGLESGGDDILLNMFEAGECDTLLDRIEAGEADAL